MMFMFLCILRIHQDVIYESSILVGSTLIPYADTIWPRNDTSLSQKAHLTLQTIVFLSGFATLSSNDVHVPVHP